MTKRKKWIALGVGVAVVAVVVVVAVKKGGNQGTVVREEKVGKRDLIASVTASGQVQPHTKVDVASDVSGRIMRLAVKEGDGVKQGQVVATIGDEKLANPFLRADQPEVAAAIGMAGKEPSQVFAEIRARKNKF